MTSNESWRKYLEAGAAVGQATAARAEDIARRLFDDDEGEREGAWRDLEQLTRFGRVVGEQLAEMARSEITRQLKTLGGGSFDQLFDRIADLLGGSPAQAPPAAELRDTVLEASVVVVPTAPEPQKKSKGKGKKHKKASSEKGTKKHKKKEKDAPKQQAADTVRVLTMAPPPEPAGGS